MVESRKEMTFKKIHLKFWLFKMINSISNYTGMYFKEMEHSRV